MVGIKNLDILLKSMKPELDSRVFVFCTLSEEKLKGLKLNPLLIFKEKEGITIILEKDFADKNNLEYSGTRSLITLTVHSDLFAVGFLAAITKKLADANISVNVISAYYHDYLFVPTNRNKEAIKLLQEFS
jgi:hypothetical protein